MKRRLVLILCSLVLAGIAGGLAAARVTAESLPAASEALGTSSSPQGGPDPAALFSKLCAACHGQKGEGGFGPVLTHRKDLDEAKLADVIAHGRGSMPAVGGSLNAAEVDALVRFVAGGLNVTTAAPAKPVPASVPTAAPVLPAILRVDLEAGSQGHILARVDLRSGQDAPIAGAPISLYRLTAMRGRLLLAQLTTDGYGKASFTLDAFEGQTVKVEATYGGSTKWGSAKAEAGGEAQRAPEAPSLISDLTSRSSPLPLVAVFAVVLGGVWLTYGLVVYRLLQILRQAKA